MKNIVETKKAPAAIGPYVQGIINGNTVYTSGQLPIDPETGVLEKCCIYAQTKRSLDNVAAIIEEAGFKMADVIKTTVFITDMEDFSKVNEVYEDVFKETKPARSCVQVAALPKGAMIEIEAIAVR
ncbi:MAG: RidA family protein [Clostridiales bacterium]|nr:RidA family protein [Clostridiales bacterium]